jgi:hypothetical protein
VDSEFEGFETYMRENDSHYIDKGDYFSSPTKAMQTTKQKKENKIIHTDSQKTYSDESQRGQDCEVKSGANLPAEKLGSERSLRASLGGEDKPSDPVDTVYRNIFNTVPSGPKTNFSTQSTLHIQALLDFLTTTSPSTAAPQKAPLFKSGVHENV